MRDENGDEIKISARGKWLGSIASILVVGGGAGAASQQVMTARLESDVQAKGAAIVELDREVGQIRTDFKELKSAIENRNQRDEEYRLRLERLLGQLEVLTQGARPRR